MTTQEAHPLQVTLCYLRGVSWSFYGAVQEAMGNRHLRLAYRDGEMEFICPVQFEWERPDQYFYLNHVSWSFYQRALEEFGERNLRITYLDGEIEIMSPLPKHEAYKKALADLIAFLTAEWRVSRKSFGSATFYSQPKEGGAEPDECFYFGDIESIRGMERFDALVHRPPDLVIEAEVFKSVVSRQPIYARLGVPEIWRYDGKELRVLALTASSAYVAQERSALFPTLPMKEFSRFARKMIDEDETAVLSEFRRWLQSVPRHQPAIPA